MREPITGLRTARRRWPRLLQGVLTIGFLIMFGLWQNASSNGGQKPAEPFRIAGNLYYVGANDVTAFLLTGPKGHVLIDGGYPGTAPMIMASIAKLGFRITDVKLLLNTEGHFDHAGGLAALKEASGAELWVSEGETDTIESGGAKDLSMGPLRFLALAGITSYPAAQVDHRFQDGTVLRLGPIELTAHVTPGHTQGCTSWSFPVQDMGRRLLVVAMCDLKVSPFASLVEPERYPGVRGDFERSFRTLRSLPADIYLTPHARKFGRWRKFQARAKAANPAEPFIDRAGYHDLIDRAETQFRQSLEKQRRARRAYASR